MLDITGNDIKDLNDSDLRSLIGLLCEAELSCNSLPTAGVTWGGHQNAADGGIDVRVEVTEAPHQDSYIPRAVTLFQVKKPDMPRAEILNEMKPNGELRKEIKLLVGSSGAYIIISSQGSTADSSLRNRVNAMREALKELPDATNIKVDFYDRERIAGWVRSHPGVVLWIREKLGRPIQGWQSYDNWANCPDGVEGKYLSDDDVRFNNASASSPEGMSGSDGIQAIREILHTSASSVRLTGLSGVGKTRLVQALFDARIGDNALNQAQVFYSDISDSPNPSPRNFAEQLISLRRPAILVVDNCPPELHRSLNSVCTASGSLVSLITVEYDVREDQPEETEVFQLVPASAELIQKVISARFDYINNVDARTIAEFSGGNARIAIALAKTIEQGKDMSSLKDSYLLDRLFHQRYEQDKGLMKAAEVCSLVYSFDCSTDEEQDLELNLLSSLAGMSIGQLFEYISELKRRELVQQRNVWRAVLPHAIANMLAQRALDNIPTNVLRKKFEKGGSDRLLKSFSRRLSYLHENDKAKEIASEWLSENGILSDIGNLNELGMSLFKNIAPIDTGAAIDSIERAAKGDSSAEFLSKDNNNYVCFTRLLRSLAYDEKLFSRCVSLLCSFALTESSRVNSNSIRPLLKSLFQIKLSGTHAKAEQRLSIISGLMESGNDEKIELAIELLDAALEAGNFRSRHSFEFGAHSRDYGFYPKNEKEVAQWFKLFLDFLVRYIVAESVCSASLKIVLAEKFRWLWVKACLYDELEQVATVIIEKGTWIEGYVAVKKTLRFRGDSMDGLVVTRLNELATLLSPETAIERIRLYAHTGRGNVLDLIDIDSSGDGEDAISGFERLEEITKSLGQEVAKDEVTLQKIMSEFLSGNGVRLDCLGHGIADGCDQPIELWGKFKSQMSLINAEQRNYQLLRGFINGLSKKEPHIVDQLLDAAVEDDVLGNAFPTLQASALIDDKALGRIRLSLEKELSPIQQYMNLAIRLVHSKISDEDLCDILKVICSKTEGNIVAIEMLQMKLYRHSSEKVDVSNAVISLGQELLLNYDFSRESNHIGDHGYRLAAIIKACFKNPSAAKPAKKLCLKIARELSDYNIYSVEYQEVLNALSTGQPYAFLDGFLGDDDLYNKIGRFVFEDFGGESNVLSGISNDIIIAWCEVDPEARYPVLSSAIRPYQNIEETTDLEWTSLFQRIIENSSDPVIILNKFKSIFRPMSWTGSRVGVMQKRLPLITQLRFHENSLVAEWATREEAVFQDEIASEREWELKRDSSKDERFE